jgi:hypothetical protein
MSAQIMKPGRPAYDQQIARGGTTEQAAGAALGYLAYSSPYSVDEATGVVHHHVTVSLLPNWLGSIQVWDTQRGKGVIDIGMGPGSECRLAGQRGRAG